MKLNSQTQSQGFSGHSVTLRQWKRALPEDRRLDDVILTRSTVGDAALRSKIYAKEKFTWVPLIALGGAAVAAATCAACSAVGLPPMLAVMTSISSLGIAIQPGVMGLRRSMEKAYSRGMEINEAADRVAQSLVVPQPGGQTFADHRFLDAGVFSDPHEIRAVGSGDVLERRVKVELNKPLFIHEDVAQGLVTLSTDTQKATFPGTLTLPTASRGSELRVTRQNPHLPKSETPQGETHLEIQMDGNLSFRLDRLKMEAGFDNKFYSTGQPGGQTYVASAPLNLSELGFPGQPVASQGLTCQGRLPGLSLRFPLASMADLKPMEASAVKISSSFDSASFSPPAGQKLEFKKTGDAWTVSNAAGQTETFRGGMDAGGKLVCGTVIQQLGVETIVLQQTLAGSSISVTHSKGMGATATYSPSPDAQVAVPVQLTESGDYQVKVGEQSHTVRPILSSRLLWGAK